MADQRLTGRLESLRGNCQLSLRSWAYHRLSGKNYLLRRMKRVSPLPDKISTR